MMVPEGLEGGLGGNTVRVLVLPYEIFSSTPTSCYIMKISLRFYTFFDSTLCFAL